MQIAADNHYPLVVFLDFFGCCFRCFLSAQPDISSEPDRYPGFVPEFRLLLIRILQFPQFRFQFPDLPRFILFRLFDHRRIHASQLAGRFIQLDPQVAIRFRQFTDGFCSLRLVRVRQILLARQLFQLFQVFIAFLPQFLVCLAASRMLDAFCSDIAAASFIPSIQEL
ncbi:MAG: hypothetical protein IKO93_05330 [Lentisphaeria bacterium]|nr:hypothetical protein [Lentisphaeria bacterium]